MQDTILVQLSPASPTLEICSVIKDFGKSLRIRNKHNGAICFVPKSSLRERMPGEPTYENEYILAPWFRDQLNAAQKRTLGVT